MVVLLVGLVPMAARADVPPAGPAFPSDRLVVHTDQESIEFHPVRIDSTLYVPTDDSGITRLLAISNTTFDWSEDHATLFIHLAAGDVHWDVTQNHGTIGKDEVDLPGAIVARDGGWLIQVAALTRFLGLTLIPVDASTGSYALLPGIQAVQITAEGGATSLVISGTGRLECEAQPGPDGLHLVFPQTGCLLPSDDLTAGPVRVHVEVRGNADQSTRLLLTFPPHWKGTVGSRLLLNQVTVHVVPDYAVGDAMMQTARITSMAIESSSPDQTVWRLDANGPYAWAWQWDAASSMLTLDVLHATPMIPTTPSQDIDNPLLTHIDTSIMNTDAYPMVHLLFKLAPNSGFKLEKTDGDIKSLRLTVGPVTTFPVATTEGSDTFKPVLHGLIVLDPGHGGSDPGCHSPLTGVREKDVTLDICMKMKDELEARGLKVVLTRTDDRDLTWPGSPDTLELGARAAVANERGADLFVSIHCNASVSPNPRGTAVHWYKEEDYPLAAVLRDGLESASLGPPVNGLIHSRFYVLRHTTVPSVLVETAYLTNPADGQMLSSDAFRKQMATTLADSLAQYMSRVSTRVPRTGGGGLLTPGLR